MHYFAKCIYFILPLDNMFNILIDGNRKLSELPFYSIKQIQTSPCSLVKQVLHSSNQERNLVFFEGEMLCKKYFEYWGKTSLTSYNSYTSRICSPRKKKIPILRADTLEHLELKLSHPYKLFTSCDHFVLLNHMEVLGGILNQILSI